MGAVVEDDVLHAREQRRVERDQAVALDDGVAVAEERRIAAPPV
jgi:hypothetical protein